MSKKPADQAEQQEQAKEELAEEQVQEQQEAEKAADLPEDEEKVPVTEEEAERAHEPEQEDSEHRDENDGLAGLDEDELPEDVAPLPVEVKKSLEAEYPVLQEHGSHNAAMKGLQTDASGSYDRSKL